MQEFLQIHVGKFTILDIIYLLVLTVVCLFIVKQLMRLVERILTRLQLDKTLHSFFKSVVKVSLYFMVFVILADSVGISITSLVAAFSVVGLAVSLAIQGALSNVAGGIVLLVSKPFAVGDFIECGSDNGTVKEINLLTTKLLTLDNKKIIIPNSDISSARIVNFTAEENRRVDIVITASYDAKISDVKSAIFGEIEAIENILDEPKPFVMVSNYLDSSIEYTVRVWAKAELYWDVYFALLEAIKVGFDKNNIEMTYPHLNVHMMDK